MSANDSEIILDDLHIDAITEVLNIGMGSAAASLSEMLNEEVIISVPEMDFIDHQTASRILSDNEGKKVLGIRQGFAGPFAGDAFLLFSEKNSRDLVRLALGESIGLESLREMEQEALAEISNVIINACLGSLANLFGETINTDLPVYVKDGAMAMFKDVEEYSPQNQAKVLFLKMTFDVKEKDVNGYISFVMDRISMESFKRLSMESFKRCIDRLLELN